jgi:hypothetical protein
VESVVDDGCGQSRKVSMDQRVGKRARSQPQR